MGLAKAESSFRKGLRSSVAEIEAKFSPNFASTLQNALNITEEVHLVGSNSGLKRRRRREKILELAPALDARYGNSGALFSGRLEIDAALAPFEACQYSDTDKSGVPSPESLLRPARVGKDSGAISCEYDEYFPIKSSSQLLRRVSISNVVDVFSKRGRLRLFRSFVSVSELVEPTFEEVSGRYLL